MAANHPNMKTTEENLDPNSIIEDDTKLRRKLVNDFASASLNQMKVYLRVRPLTSKETAAQECVFFETNHSVLFNAPQQSATFRNNATNDAKTKQRFTFNRVFASTVDQKSFFDGAILGTVSEFINGNNCLVFAYGTTNSGKTYTVQGSADQPGVIPLSIDVIFNSVGDRLDNVLNLRPLNTSHVEQLMPKQIQEMKGLKNTLLQGIDEFYTSCSSLNSEESRSMFESSSKDEDEIAHLSIHESNNFRFRIWVSFSEIYNENIYDLLDVNPEKRKKLRLTLDRSGNSFIKGLKIIPVQSPKEARQFLSLGRKNLHISSTKLNQSSSRSHCIYTLYMVRVVDTLDPQQAMINSLSFCDLAGSERTVKTQNTGDRLREAGKINSSLMVFGRCIEALRAAQHSKERPIIPFRDSKLTQLFQFFFNGKGRASMIVNVSPNADMFDETINVLRVSAIAKQVISTDQLDKTFLNASTSARLTDLWAKSNQRWSSFSRGRELPSKMSIMTQKEDSAIAEEDEEQQHQMDQTVEEEPDVQELVDMFIKLEGIHNSLVDDYNELEAKLRTEIGQEYQSQFVALEKSCESRIEEARENAEELMEKRLAILKKSIYGRRGSTCQDESSQDSGDDDDKNYNSDEETVDQETLITTLDAVQNELSEIRSDRDTFARHVQELQLELEERNLKLKALETQPIELDEQKQETLLIKNQLSELMQQSDAMLFEKDNKIQTLTASLTKESNLLCTEKTDYELIIKGLEEEIAKINKLLTEKIEDSKSSDEIQKAKITSLEEDLLKLKNDYSLEKVRADDLDLKFNHSEIQTVKMTSLEEDLLKLKNDYSLEKARADNLDLKFKHSEISNKSEIDKMTELLTKMGDVLFEKDEEIQQQTLKYQELDKEHQQLKILQLSDEEIRKDSDQLAKALADIKELEETVCKKDAEIGVLKTQIMARECVDNSVDFKQPAKRRAGRPRRAAKENIPLQDDSQSSLLSSQSDDSMVSDSKITEQTKSSLGVLEYIKQSPPVLAARNAIDSFMGSVSSYGKTCDESQVQAAAEGQRRLRRKLYKEDSYQTLECSPPKQVVMDPSAHSIVKRQLRSKSKK